MSTQSTQWTDALFSRMPPDMKNERTVKRLQQYAEKIDESAMLFVSKNSKYRDAFEEAGVVGAVAKLVTNTKRIRNRVLKEPDHGEADKHLLKEILQDIRNYTVIAELLIDQENWDGLE